MEIKEIIKVIKDHEERLQRLEKEPESIKQNNEKNIFDIEEEQLTLIKHVGKDIREKVKNISLLVLWGYKTKLKKIKVLGSEIRRNIALNKVPIENFGTYLNDLIPQSILRIGKTRSSKTSYKLTPFGEAKVKELLKSL